MISPIDALVATIMQLCPAHLPPEVRMECAEQILNCAVDKQGRIVYITPKEVYEQCMKPKQ